MGKSPKKHAAIVGKEADRLYIGEWIAALGAKQNEVAKAAGIGESYLSLLIDRTKGNPSARILYRISEFLGVNVNVLYNPPPPPTELEMLGQVPPRLWRAFLEVQAMMTRKR